MSDLHCKTKKMMDKLLVKFCKFEFYDVLVPYKHEWKVY
jgi:hypothetical protein